MTDPIDQTVEQIKAKAVKDAAAEVQAATDLEKWALFYLGRQDMSPERNARILDEFLVRQYQQLALPPDLAKIASAKTYDGAARAIFVAWWVWEAEQNNIIHDRGIRVVVAHLDKVGEPVPHAFRFYLEARPEAPPDHRRGPKRITKRGRDAVIIGTVADLMRGGLDEIGACSVVQKALEVVYRHMTTDAILKIWKRRKNRSGR